MPPADLPLQREKRPGVVCYPRHAASSTQVAPGGAGRETRFFFGRIRTCQMAEGNATQSAQRIEQQVESLLARRLPDVDLRAVGVGGRGGAGVLRVVIDHPVGVDHDLCGQVTRVLGEANLLDLYSVEVSSPGPEPPLRITRHFTEAIGGQVKLSVDPDVVPGSAKSVSGTLVEATDESLTLASDSGVVVVPRDAVRRARLVKGGGSE